MVTVAARDHEGDGSLSSRSNGAARDGLKLKPLETSAAEVDFGVDADVLDLPHLSDDGFAALERAVLTHQVVVVRGQGGLSPRDQFELTARFDPTA